jgi:hypothetical protein
MSISEIKNIPFVNQTELKAKDLFSPVSKFQ